MLTVSIFAKFFINVSLHCCHLLWERERERRDNKRRDVNICVRRLTLSSSSSFSHSLGLYSWSFNTLEVSAHFFSLFPFFSPLPFLIPLLQPLLCFCCFLFIYSLFPFHFSLGQCFLFKRNSPYKIISFILIYWPDTRSLVCLFYVRKLPVAMETERHNAVPELF